MCHIYATYELANKDVRRFCIKKICLKLYTIEKLFQFNLNVIPPRGILKQSAACGIP